MFKSSPAYGLNWELLYIDYIYARKSKITQNDEHNQVFIVINATVLNL